MLISSVNSSSICKSEKERLCFMSISNYIKYLSEGTNLIKLTYVGNWSLNPIRLTMLWKPSYIWFHLKDKWIRRQNWGSHIFSAAFLQRQKRIVNYHVKKFVKESHYFQRIGILIHILSWRQQKHQFYWDSLTNFLT